MTKTKTKTEKISYKISPLMLIYSTSATYYSLSANFSTYHPAKIPKN